jgi:PEGA domain
MKPGYSPNSHAPLEPALTDQGLANRHVPGLSDQIGDRVVILDGRGEPSLELLRFARRLTTAAGFEVSLRRRVERLRQFRHPVFPATSAVECLGDDRRLVLLSSCTAGRRLAEVLNHARGPAFASSLIRQLTPALAMLHQYDDGIGHGALTANRIVISPDGQLIVVEHVLGSALERLQLTAVQMHLELGIPVHTMAGTGRVRMDSRTDLFQLGVIALSLLLGRQLNSDDSREHLDTALEQAFSGLDRESAEEFHWLRVWLERALQMDGRVFASSGFANDALRDVSDPSADSSAQRWQALLGIPHASAEDRVDVQEPEAPDEEPAVVRLHTAEPSTAPPDAPVDEPAPVLTTQFEESSLPSTPMADPEPPPILLQSPVEEIRPQLQPVYERVHAPAPARPRPFLKWAVVALALCAVVEGLVIARLALRRPAAPAAAKIAEVNLETPDPGATVMVDGRSAGVTPLQLKIGPEIRSISVVSPAPKQELVVGSTGQQNASPASRTDRTAEPAARPAAAVAAVPAPQRLGGIRLSSPIELEVFDGDRRLGSSATGIVPTPAGRRELDFVNSVLGFRSRRIVDIKDGQVVSIAISPPNGRININAVPWAEVLVDGKLVGETPIGNLSIPLGEHEIVFRHPQFGELRRTATVRSDAITRVSVTLER